MTITWSGLLPHPPIIVAAVGGARCVQVQKTIEACQDLACDFLANQPDRLILISPHAPRPAAGICVWVTPEIEGDFGRFGATQSKIRLPCDVAWIQKFQANYPQTQNLYRDQLDHGALVPLHFLINAGWHGPSCVIGLPWDEGEELGRIGQAIKVASQDSSRTAVLASGDMSHCLLPEGPYGYHPDGPKFDQLFIDALRHGHFRQTRAIPFSIRAAAKQDVLESATIAWTAIDFATINHRFLSYEGPFGVGYSVMKFFGVTS